MLGRFQLRPSAPSVAAPSRSRSTAMSRSPPPHSDPWPIRPRWIATVASVPTSGWLAMARSYRSANDAAVRYRGPASHGSVSRSPMRSWCATRPWLRENAPVPIVAWICAVLGGDEPTSASSYQVPSSIRPCRFGHDFGHSSSTKRPAPSQTTTTTSFGGASASGTSASVSGAPSGASNGKPTSSPWVGAMSARVTTRSTSPRASMWPGPVEQQRHLAHVVPRARVRQPGGADEVGLPRDDVDVAAAIVAMASPAAHEQLSGHVARRGRQSSAHRLRPARASPRPRCPGRRPASSHARRGADRRDQSERAAPHAAPPGLRRHERTVVLAAEQQHDEADVLRLGHGRPLDLPLARSPCGTERDVDDGPVDARTVARVEHEHTGLPAAGRRCRWSTRQRRTVALEGEPAPRCRPRR